MGKQAAGATSNSDNEPSTHNLEGSILIVEDNDNLREMYANWLDRHYTVDKAGTAYEGLVKLDQDVAIILLDRELPDRNGEAAIEMYRKKVPDCQIAIVTSLKPNFDLLEMGFDAYLTRPAREEQLQQFVTALAAEDLETLANIDGALI